MMTSRLHSPSAKNMAHVAGALYLIVIFGGLFAEAGVRQALIVGGDAQATAQNILAHETLFRLGFVVNLTYLLCNIPFAILFYHIFKSASQIVASIVVLLIVVTTTIEAVNLFYQLSAIDLIFSEMSFSISDNQRYDLAYLALQSFQNGFGVSLVFFGFVCGLYGWLILNSRRIPHIIGWLIILAGLCYLINSYAIFISPSFATHLFPAIFIPCLIGELSLASWLAFKGAKHNENPEQV